MKQGAINKLNTMKEVATRLIPQIMQWMTTGVVAKGKILHTGLTQVRAIIRKPKERRWGVLQGTGQRSMLSLNLNNLMRDLANSERRVKEAQI
ncbi:MAG: hypothetical protein DDT24_00663 [Chloroflexi bacterium]|nr:hypothetical protein [Chloroflexota bacterium]